MTAGRTVNSQNSDWCTPPKYVEAVRNVLGGQIAFDPCSNEWSIVNADTELQLPDCDGLKVKWDYPTIYVNPPYGADRDRGTTIRDWLYKCADAFTHYYSEVLALVPVAPNTTHWKHHAWGRATGICFLYDTRLRFLVEGRDKGKGAPMACAMIYWGRHYEHFRDVFIEYGAVVDIRPLRGKVIGRSTTQEQPKLLDAL